MSHYTNRRETPGEVRYRHPHLVGVSLPIWDEHRFVAKAASGWDAAVDQTKKGLMACSGNFLYWPNDSEINLCPGDIVVLKDSTQQIYRVLVCDEREPGGLRVVLAHAPTLDVRELVRWEREELVASLERGARPVAVTPSWFKTRRS